MTDQNKRDYSISVLEYALQALETFLTPGTCEQSLSEITRRMGINKSRAFRILSTLQQHGFLEQESGTRNYRLGLKLMALGEAVKRRLNLLEVARPILDDLARQTGETIFLGMPDGLEAICVDKRESSYPVRLFGEVGRRVPLHVGGVPKVLLAYLADEDPSLIERLPLPAMTHATITNRDALLQQLQQIRAQGYFIAQDDLDLGATSISAPIRNHSGCVIAALSIAGPSGRFTPEQMEYYISCVRDAAGAISAGLGYRAMSS